MLTHTCIWELSTVLLQASSVRLMVSGEGAGELGLASCTSVCTSALYWLARASSYWSVHWRIRVSQPSAVFSSSVLASVVEF